MLALVLRHWSADFLYNNVTSSFDICLASSTFCVISDVLFALWYLLCVCSETSLFEKCASQMLICLLFH